MNHEIDPTKEVWVKFFEMMKTLPENTNVTVDGRTWSVPRLYIAVHGLKGSEVSKLGFREVTEERNVN